jgi:hypothetical protein
MISSRTGAALALVLSIVAVALGAAALFAALRGEDDDEAGRMVQTLITPSDSEPVLFELDGFYMSTGEDDKLRALYVYPPSYHGHTRGCRVEWRPFESAPDDAARPGMFIDPCGGAQFDRSGALVSGPAERGLDEFRTEPRVEGVVVDTSVLYCGVSADEDATPVPEIDREECELVR